MIVNLICEIQLCEYRGKKKKKKRCDFHHYFRKRTPPPKPTTTQPCVVLLFYKTKTSQYYPGWPALLKGCWWYNEWCVTNQKQSISLHEHKLCPCLSHMLPSLTVALTFIRKRCTQNFKETESKERRNKNMTAEIWELGPEVQNNIDYSLDMEICFL